MSNFPSESGKSDVPKFQPIFKMLKYRLPASSLRLLIISTLHSCKVRVAQPNQGHAIVHEKNGLWHDFGHHQGKQQAWSQVGRVEALNLFYFQNRKLTKCDEIIIIWFNKGMSRWCNTNCNFSPPFCPPSHCRCTTAAAMLWGQFLKWASWVRDQGPPNCS